MSRSHAGGRRLAARFVVLDPEHVLANGELEWDAAGRLQRIARARGAVADLCVIPGLVNAHAHLQLPALSTPQRQFLPWVAAVMAARAALDAAAERAQLRTAIDELVASGATAVGEIDSTGRSLAMLSRARLTGRCYRELTGFHLDAAGARALLRERALRPRAGIATGWSPHAPYSVSAALFQTAARAARHLAIHCAELPEEQQFLHTGRGPFADLLQRLGRLPAGFRAPGVGAVRWLERLGVLRPTTQLVHCQELERGDLPRLVAAGASVVVCPGTIEYFGRTPPPVPRWLAAGVPVALGTDSRASNTALSLQHELQRAASLWPQLAPATLLAMATSHGARSLGLARAGLRRGRRADFVALAAQGAGSAWDAFQRFVGGAPPDHVVVAGRRHRPTTRG